MIIKDNIKKIINFLGYDLKKITSLFYNCFNSDLKFLNIDTVIDIGASKGNYAKNLRKNGYKNLIISIEPILSDYNNLIHKSKNDKKWLIHERCAIDNKNSKKKFYISKNFSSSSLLKIKSNHIKSDPNSKKILTKMINTQTLEDIYKNYNLKNKNKNVYLKLDVQGNEKNILDGGKKILKEFSAIEIELSTVSLYEQSKEYTYFVNFFKKKGFILYDIERVFFNKKKMQLLQFNALFVNKDKYKNIIK